MIAKRAARIVVAAEYFRIEGVGPDDPRRIEIVNGVDEDDLLVDATGPHDRFVLAHVGSLYDLRDPAPALRAIARLVADGTVDGDRLEVRLVGNVWIPDFAPPPGLWVTVAGYVTHREAVSEMAAATALLLYVPKDDLAPSGKLFEYLASGRPLLCLASERNLASRLVREWGAGLVADPQEEEAIAAAFVDLWHRWESEDLPDQTEVRARALERYSRRANATRLAEVLEAARGD
jgi:glycosyltransferase involved in cell wall biosynthesis